MLDEATLETLRGRFVGKRVNVTHPGAPPSITRLDRMNDLCTNVHIYPWGIDIELEEGYRMGLKPDKLTETSFEGGTATLIDFRRRVELVQE